MSLVRTIYSTNVYLIFVLGFFSSSFLLWLIVYHTPSTMNPYKRILLQACIIDLAIISTQTGIQPIFFIDGNGMPSIVLGSPLVSWSPFPWNTCFYNIWALVANTSSMQYGLLFFYRWLVVTRSYNIPFTTYMLLLLVPSFTETLLQMFFGNDFHTSATEQNITEWIGVELEVGTWPHPMRNTGSTAAQYFNTMQSVYFALTFFAAVVFAVMTSRFVRRNLNNPSEKRNRELNAQLNRVMVLQAIVAFIFSYFPIVILNMITRFWATHPSLNDLIWLINSIMVIGFWLPLLNSFVTIFSVKSYRKFVSHVFCRHSLLQSSVKINFSQQPVLVVSKRNNEIRNQIT